LSLSVQNWRLLSAELSAMEHVPHLAAVPVEKQLERDRAGEQLAVMVSGPVEQTLERGAAELIEEGLPLIRSTAKYLLTACDRLRRSALIAAHAGSGDTRAAAQADAKMWDQLMRQLTAQHGTVHPFPEMVAPLPFGESDLAAVGFAPDALQNGQDLLQ
jgi:hypothetical protein